MHNPMRRRLILAGGALLLSSRPILAGAQREETLSDDVASVMRTSVNNVNPARLVFTNPRDGERWLRDMSARLTRFVPDEPSRRRLLINIQYETTRAGIDTQLILGLIEVESAFRQYAISNVGAKGLMQVMPFWQRYIGKPEHNLFDIRTNLRYARRTFDAPGSLVYRLTRKDHEYQANASIWHNKIAWKGLVPHLNFRYLKIDSNMSGFYSRKSMQTFISVEKQF